MDCRQVRSKEDRKKSPVQEDVTVRVRERAKSDGRVNVEGTRPKTPSSADDIKHTSVKCPQYKAGDYNELLFKYFRVLYNIRPFFPSHWQSFKAMECYIFVNQIKQSLFPPPHY